MYDRPPGLSPASLRIAHVTSCPDIGQFREMETVPLELPAELVKLAQFDTGNLLHETAKVLALDLFRERKISIGRAAELCETPPAAFMDFAVAQLRS